MAEDFRLTRKSETLAFLETDRLYAAYAIGDLEPGPFERCDWYGAGDAGLEALVLVFHGFTPPVLFLMGDGVVLGRVLAGIDLPEAVYLNCREEHLSAAASACTWDGLVPMWRMALQGQARRAAGDRCIPLGPSDAGRLRELYAAGGGEAFSPAQMERGVYCGIVEEGRVVAAAGTHIVSDTFGVAAIGNVFTHPKWRRRGLGLAVTGSVVERLARRGVRDIILNVAQANHAAIHLYERLGFRRYCAFLEGPVRTRRAR